jgi:oxalate decarboxylase
MNTPNRRSLLAAAAAFGATAAASAQQGNEPVIGNKGAPIIGPRNPARELQNPEILRPPSTDHG